MRRLVAILCVTAVVAAACASGPNARQPQPSSSPSTPPSTAVANAPADVTKLEKGKDYDVVATLPAQIDGSRTYWRGVDAAGTAYGEITVTDPTVDRGSMGLNFYTQPVLMDTDGTLTRMTPVRDAGTRTQMTGGDIGERWVTWLESASSQVGSGMWTLFSYERSTGTLRQLGSWKDAVAGKDSTLDYEGRPEILGDDVIMTAWSSVRRQGTGKVLTAPLNGSAPLTELVPDAKDPDVDEQGFSYVDGSGALMYRETATGDARQVSPAGTGCQFYESQVLLTCVPSGSGTVVRIAGPSGEATFGPYEHISNPTLRDGWATFAAVGDSHPVTYAIDVATSTAYEAWQSEYGWSLMGHGYAGATLRGGDDDDGDPTGYQLIKLR